MKKDLYRMSHWLLFSVMLYVFAWWLAQHGIDYYPQLQTILWKLGHITLAGFIGYWLDRTVFRSRLGEHSSDVQEIRRAIIVVGTMIAIALGM